ncbi:HTH domain-containing protein [Thermoproteota archaeon]
MSNRKDHENMIKLDRCYKIVLQSSSKGGIRVDELKEKLGVHRTTAYNYLNSLDLMGKVYSDQGLWKAKTGEQTIKPLEKEIEIVLPLPEDEWRRVALLEHFAIDWENCSPKAKENPFRITLEKFNETRTIKIKGKNVDDLDLEKMAVLAQKAIEKSSSFNLKSILRKFKL